MRQSTCGCDLTMASQLIADEVVCQRMATLYKALSEPIRVKIVLALLHSEVCVQGLVELLNASQPSISNQLSRLKRDGLVKCRKVKNHIYYSLDDQHVHDLVDIALLHVAHTEVQSC